MVDELGKSGFKKRLMTATEESSLSPKYKRIILKLSGEVLRNNEDGEPIDPVILKAICEEVKKFLMIQGQGLGFGGVMLI